MEDAQICQKGTPACAVSFWCAEIQLGDRDKPMDIVSRWRGLVHHYSGEKVHEIPQLYLRANVFAFPERHKHVSVCVCACIGVVYVCGKGVVCSDA